MISCSSFRSVRIAARLFLLILAIGLGGAAPPPGPAAPAAQPSAEELKKLVGTLQDDQQRAQLVKQLQALIAAQEKGGAAPAPAEPSDLISEATARLQQFGDDLANT